MINFFITDNNYDIADYVNDCDNVPFVALNRDFTLAAKEITLKISNTCPYSFLVGDVFSIWIGNQSIFRGRVITKDYITDERKYQVRIAPAIKDLQSYKVRYSVLHSIIVSRAAGDYTKYRAADDIGCPNIQVTHLIECLFAKIGFDVYWGNTKTQNIIDPKTNGYFTLNIGGTNYNIKLEQLYIDENIMYAIGQTYAEYYSNYDPMPGTNYIDCFDLLGYILSAFGLRCVFTHTLTEYGYKITMNDFADPAISDDLNESERRNTSVKSELQLAKSRYHTDRVKYRELINNDLDEHEEVENSYPTNLYFLYSASIPGTATAGYVLNAANFRYAPDYVNWRKRKGLESDQQTKTNLTEFNFTTTVKETSFDFKNMQTEIIQEAAV